MPTSTMMQAALSIVALLLAFPSVHAQAVSADTVLTRTVEASGMAPLEILFAALNVVVLAATGLIVWRYTVHTYELRKAAEKQTGLVQDQIEQMEKNYQQLVRQLDFEVERADWRVRPVLTMRSWDWKRPMIWNKGGYIRDIKLEPEGDFTISIDRQEILRTGQQARITVSCSKGEMQEGVYFVMRFINEWDRRKAIRYCLKSGKIYEDSKEENETAAGVIASE